MKIDMLMLNILAARTASEIDNLIPKSTLGTVKIFGIPRGGICAALAIGNHIRIELVDDPSKADVFVDDLVDSGNTMEKWCDEYPGIPFFALIDKRLHEEFQGQWIVFPWEQSEEKSIEDNIIRLLEFVGEDPKRGGLLETPKRVAKAWKHWCSGYGQDPALLLKVFEDGAEQHDQMITVKDIPIYSHCEHHLAPIIGQVTISYIPNGKIVGLSKLSRLADVFARRLQVQERLTDQIADALFNNLQPKGVGVSITARHLCMESRGICKQGHATQTTALRGVFKDEADTKAEFLRLVK